MNSTERVEMLTWESARARIEALCARRRLPRETVAIGQAAGRVLAGDVHAPIDLPPFANAAMDGFALQGRDLAAEGEIRLRIIGTRLAGDSTGIECGPGECVRITTGAAMPATTDTVVIKENVRIEGDWAVIGPGEAAGSHVRPAGDDVARNERIASAGDSIGVGLLGMLAALGMDPVEAFRQPRVSVLSTGDELVLPGMPRSGAQIYNSNGYSIAAMLRASGLDPACAAPGFEHVRDDRVALREAILRAAERSDVIITSGGVSAGEADHLPGLVEELGRIEFWKVRMRPGMPFLCGEVGDALIFCLPGNPVSTVASFQCLLRPGLDVLMGKSRVQRPWHARLGKPVHKRHARTEFMRGQVSSQPDGTLRVEAVAKQGSAMIHGLLGANALIVVPEAARELEAGSVVEVLPLPGAYWGT